MKRVAVTDLSAEKITKVSLDEFYTPNWMKSSIGMKSSIITDEAIKIKIRSGESYFLTKEMLCCLIDVTIQDAARFLRVSLSLMKRIRVWAGINRWPCKQVLNGSYPGVNVFRVRTLRDELISVVEEELRRHFSDELRFSLNILLETRSYAALHARKMVGACLRMDVAQDGPVVLPMDVDDRVLQIMDSMRPIAVRAAPSAPNLLQSDAVQAPYEQDFEDELGLGPLLDVSQELVLQP